MRQGFPIRFFWFITAFQFFVMAFAPLLLSQESDAEKKADIEEFTPGWWKGITAQKGEVLQASIEEIIRKSEALSEGLTGENKEAGVILLNDIKLNLQAFSKIIQQPFPKDPEPSTLSNTYSLDELLRLNSDYLKNQAELTARKDEEAEMRLFANNLQTKFDRVWQDYLSAEKRSEAKALLGLEVISLYPALSVAERKYQLHRRSIEVNEKKVKYLSEAVKAAEERLTISSETQTQLARQIDPLMRLWNEAKRERQQNIAEIAEKFSTEQTESAKTLNQYLSQKQMGFYLDEIDTQNRLIRIEILYTLAKVLNEPNEVDLDSAVHSQKDWSLLLDTFATRLNEWESQAHRAIDKSVQALSLETAAPSKEIEESRELLRQTIDLVQKNLLSIQKLRKETEETKFLLSLLVKRLEKIQGPGKFWLNVAVEFLYDVVGAARETISVTLFYIGTHPVTPLDLAYFVVIMVLTWWLTRVITSALNTFTLKRRGIRKSLIYRMSTLLRYLFLFIGLLVALTSIGFDFSNFLLVAGALGIGIGFGLQGIFNNFISGLIILFQGHLKVGDFIELDNNLRGEIREINVRSTLIVTNDGVDVIIPNAEMISSRVINWTLRDPYRRVHIPFAIEYGSDIDEAARIVVEAAKKVPSTLDKIGFRDPQVYLSKFGDNALEMELVVWVTEKSARRHRRTLSDYLWIIEKALKKNGFKIPFPQRDLHVKTVLDKKEIKELQEGRPFGRATEPDK